MNILVTGAAGFIGSNLCLRLLKEQPDDLIVGMDNVNDYYDVRIKEWRLEQLAKYDKFVFVKGNLADLICDTSSVLSGCGDCYNSDHGAMSGAARGV